MREQRVAEQKKAEVAERIPELEDKVEELSKSSKKVEADRDDTKKFGKSTAKNMAEDAKFGFQRCVDQVVFVDPGFDFNHFQLAYEYRDDKILAL